MRLYEYRLCTVILLFRFSALSFGRVIYTVFFRYFTLKWDVIDTYDKHVLLLLGRRDLKIRIVFRLPKKILLLLFSNRFFSAALGLITTLMLLN